MQRQSVIYTAYAVLSIALCAYLLAVCATAWERFGLSGTFALVSSLAFLFANLTAFNFWVAFLFKRRAVAAIRKSGSGILLIPENGSFPGPVSVDHVRIVRPFGKQFAHNESAPKFVLLNAANKYWVAQASQCIPFRVRLE